MSIFRVGDFRDVRGFRRLLLRGCWFPWEFAWDDRVAVAHAAPIRPREEDTTCDTAGEPLGRMSGGMRPYLHLLYVANAVLRAYLRYYLYRRGPPGGPLF